MGRQGKKAVTVVSTDPAWLLCFHVFVCGILVADHNEVSSLGALQDWSANLRLQFSNDVSSEYFSELYNGSEIYKGELESFRAVTDQANVRSYSALANSRVLSCFKRVLYIPLRNPHLLESSVLSVVPASPCRQIK